MKSDKRDKNDKNIEYNPKLNSCFRLKDKKIYISCPKNYYLFNSETCEKCPDGTVTPEENKKLNVNQIVQI